MSSRNGRAWVGLIAAAVLGVLVGIGLSRLADWIGDSEPHALPGTVSLETKNGKDLLAIYNPGACYQFDAKDAKTAALLHGLAKTKGMFVEAHVVELADDQNQIVIIRKIASGSGVDTKIGTIEDVNRVDATVDWNVNVLATKTNFKVTLANADEANDLLRALILLRDFPAVSSTIQDAAFVRLSTKIDVNKVTDAGPDGLCPW